MKHKKIKIKSLLKKENKKYFYVINVILLIIILLFINQFINDGAKKEVKKTPEDKIVSIDSPGIYGVNDGLKSGNYYVILTNKKSPSKSKITLYTLNKKKKNKFLKTKNKRDSLARQVEELSQLGDKFKITLSKKELLYFDGPKQSEWTIKLFNKKQAKKWEQKNNYRIESLKQSIRESNKQETEEKQKEEFLKTHVEVPDPYFKNKEQVEEEFKSVDLKPKFVVANFDSKAISNESTIRKGDCDQLSSDQKAVQYYSGNTVEDSGYYAKKGTTVIVGYSDHDYDGTSGKEKDSDSDSDDPEPTANKNADQHTQYVKDYVGRNASDVGSMRLGGDFMDDYAGVSVKIVFISDNGDQVTEDNVSNFTVESQDPEPDTKVTITYPTDEDGEELENLGDASPSEITVHVTKN